MPEANTRTIGDVASLVRAKNAGPFWLTLEVFFPDSASYRAVQESGVITGTSVAELYNTPEAGVQIFNLDALHVIKISFPRPTTQGAFADRDMHSGQQSTPLAQLPLPR
ncbi:DUF4387 domain-containing protein [Rhodococcus opacus]|jgi:hypothetical protein|uniref:DUF4387 domain-containing protein n=1 Tax=Rhodococcus opacus TaxID=37919 RepID=A0A2S8J948_RHOOP|nr:DUF4387 domain-containing protein [Rhodococcus opacus]PQP23517.1 DUF4387 domain-containing protein [Rhodococcus opacus]